MQTIILIGNLEFSDRKDFNPFKFCFSLKDYEGLPIKVNMQQDAQEFLNIFFDKLEICLRNSCFKYILQGVFGGKICTQLICSQCGKIKENHENFYNISLEVKNLKTIYESFNKFISGEIISDYECSNCEKKVETTKKSTILELPNILILHLQRIVFNMDTYSNQKINSRLEFPFDLDLEAYLHNSKTINTKDYFQYKLKGVVVHMGTADFGHYISYIKIRDNKWLQFNDTEIKDFDLKTFENECFGGMYFFFYGNNIN